MDTIGQNGQRIEIQAGVASKAGALPVLSMQTGAANSSYGVAGSPVTSADMSAAAVAVTDLPVAGQKLVITDIHASANANVAITFTEETSGRLVEKIYFGTNAQPSDIAYASLKKLVVANKRLMAQTDKIGAVTIDVGYYSEP